MSPTGGMDPSFSGDPVATQTQWTPLVPGGSNFATHRLVELDQSRLAMKPTLGLRLFGLVFLLVGLGSSGGGLAGTEWFLALFGLPFVAVGLYVLWPHTILFDGGARLFTGKKGQVPFSTIHALQVLKEHVSNSDNDYFSYELNLVLQNGERINVVDHAALARIRDDARRLSALIGCKIWDAAPR